MHKTQVFVVNSASAETSTRVNVRVAVNASTIRREQHNGREHIVVPSFTLPDEVIMNGGLYPHDEIEKSYKSLEGTLAPLGHPQVDGDYVSARQPEAINAYHVGAWNRNVRRVGNRIALDKWVDVEYAKNSEGGRALLEAIDKGEPIHTSTGIFLDREMTPNADGYGWIARNMNFDHDALLVGEIGAATPEDGVGMLVNKTLVINSVVVNEEALDNSYGEKMELLSAAVKEKFASGDSYAYVQDFDDQGLVYCTPDGMYKISYHMENGNPILTGESQAVIAKTEYMVKNEETLFARLLERFKSVVQYSSTKTKQPVQANVNEEVDMTPEQVQAIVDKALEATNASLASVQAENEKLKADVLAANTAIAANAESGLKDKRAAVAKVHGEVVANALNGEALDAMFASVQTAAGIVSGAPVTNAKDEFEGYSLNQADQEAK
jgi:hypothetical protein